MCLQLWTHQKEQKPEHYFDFEFFEESSAAALASQSVFVVEEKNCLSLKTRCFLKMRG